MIDPETLQMLIYQHVVQLTLLDHRPLRAFRIAHRVAALAFDEAFTTSGLAAARPAIEAAAEGATAVTADDATTKAQPISPTASKPSRKAPSP